MFDECRTLSYYSITNGSTVYLSSRLLGGDGGMSPRVLIFDDETDGIKYVQRERGVVCFGKRTNQKFVPDNEPFVPREEILFKRFTLELRCKPKYSLSP